MAASTWPNSVVGMFTYAVPRWYEADGEPGDIGDDATPHGHHHIGAGEAGLGEAATQHFHGRQRLARLPLGHGADLEGHAGVQVDQPPRLLHRFLGDHEGALGRRRHEAGQLVAGAPPDEDRVRTRAQRDLDLPYHGRPRASTPAMIRPPTWSGLRSSTSIVSSATSA